VGFHVDKSSTVINVRGVFIVNQKRSLIV